MKKETRDRFLLPFLLPVVILLFILGITVGMSRILLSINEKAATVTALLVGISIVTGAAIISQWKRIGASQLLLLVVGVGGVAMLAGGVALATVGGPETGKPKPVSNCVTVNVAAPVGAATSGFDTQTLTTDPGKCTTIKFDNKDTGVAHNVEVLSADPAKDPSAKVLFAPPSNATITGPATADYKIAPLDAGTYLFHCYVHPTTMTGSFVVGSASGGAASPSPGGKQTQASKPAASNSSSASPAPAPAAAARLALAAPPNAAATGFDKTTLSAPVGSAITIDFDNQDPGMPHNVEVFATDPASDSSAKPIFAPDGNATVTGPGKATYAVGSLAAGTYYYECYVHPATMKGTLKVA